MHQVRHVIGEYAWKTFLSYDADESKLGALKKKRFVSFSFQIFIWSDHLWRYLSELHFFFFNDYDVVIVIIIIT